MQRQHVIAEVEAVKAGRTLCYLRIKVTRPLAVAHVQAWRQHKIDTVLDHFINTYSLQARELAGGPL